jgi:hypothetical protein
VNISPSLSSDFFALLLLVFLTIVASVNSVFSTLNRRESFVLLPSRLRCLRENDDGVRHRDRRGVARSLERGSSEVFYWEFF